MKNILKYCAFLLFLYGLWYVVLGYFPFLIFFMCIILIVICLLLSIVPMKKTMVKMLLQEKNCIRDDIMRVTFCRHDDFHLPCGQIIIEYQVMDVFSQLVFDKKVFLHGQQIEVEIPCPHCGHYIVQIRKIKCYDLLNCFSLSRSVLLEQSYEVIPHYTDMDLSINQVWQFDEQGTSYHANQKGDDYSEIFEIRSYHEGDELKHIHWNVSSKFQELFVKVGSLPVQQKIILAMEYRANDSFYDLQFDCFYSLCLTLIKRNILFEVVTICNSQQIYLQPIHSLEDILETTRWLMKNPIQTLNSSLMPQTFCQLHGQKLEVHHL